MKRKIFFTLFAVTIISLLISSCGREMKETNSEGKESAKIIVYAKGKTTNVDVKSPYFAKLKTDCEDLLTSADDTVRLAIMKEDIQKIKSESAIELIYPEVRKFKINYGPQTINIDRILIPLNENPPAMIIKGLKDYESGPFTNSKGTETIKELLQLMKIEY